MDAFKEVHLKTAKEIFRTDLEQEWQSFHGGKGFVSETPKLEEGPKDGEKETAPVKSGLAAQAQDAKPRKKRKRIEKVEETLAEVAHRALERSLHARNLKKAKSKDPEDCWGEVEDTLSKRKYYVNRETGESTWFNPRKWHQAKTLDGKVYWFKGKQSTWTEPKELKEENESKDSISAPPGFKS